MIWDYMNQFVEFNRFTNSPIANYKGEIYNLPFNMNTFNKIWGVVTPDEARLKIEKQKAEAYNTPQNFEEQAINAIGLDIYDKLVKGYTEKQWGRKATDLPVSIFNRIPVRFTYDNNYFNDQYQGIPKGGYNVLVEKMLQGSVVELGVDYFHSKEALDDLANKVVFTGMIDEYFEHRLGPLEYRSLRFEDEVVDIKNYQGNAVVNFTDAETPYTRIIEHKHFEFGSQNKTVITKEYPKKWQPGEEAYYPINDDKNNELYEKYKTLAQKEKNVIFGGRLAGYKYYNMDEIIYCALEAVDNEFKSDQVYKGE